MTTGDSIKTVLFNIQKDAGVMPKVVKFTCSLMQIDLTFYTIFVPKIWFQVSGVSKGRRNSIS